MKFETGLLEILHAIGLGEDATSIESVNIQLLAWVLVATEKVAGQADAGDREPQASTNRHVQHAHGNGTTGMPVNYSVEVAVVGVVIILLISGESACLEQVLVDTCHDAFRFGTKIQLQH